MNKTLLLAICTVAAVSAASQTTLFGLGDTSSGTYQLDTATIRGAGTKTATAWVIMTPASELDAAKVGAAHMLLFFLIDCRGRTIQPMAWKARNPSGKIVAEGMHGREKLRAVKTGSMDEKIVDHVCNWRP